MTLAVFFLHQLVPSMHPDAMCRTAPSVHIAYFICNSCNTLVDGYVAYHYEHCFANVAYHACGLEGNLGLVALLCLQVGQL